MLGKRKAKAAALEVGKKPKNHGGKRQGTGPKPTPTNAPGSDAPDAPKRKQGATLSDLLGARREAQKKTTETEAVVVDLDAEEAVGAEPADYIKWTYTRHDGGDAETLLEQRQRPRGRVQYEMMKDALAIEHVRWPSFASSRVALESHGEDDIGTLLDHTSKAGP